MADEEKNAETPAAPESEAEVVETTEPAVEADASSEETTAVEGESAAPEAAQRP
jgi:hypothetical protein